MPDDTGGKFTGRPAPHPTDLHVGARIRMRRKSLRLSQEALAQALDLTFQQVQKYERGQNRISASKLMDAARALNVGVAWFFEGLAPAESGSTAGEDVVSAFLATAQGLAIARAVMNIAPHQRVAILQVAEAMAPAGGE